MRMLTCTQPFGHSDTSTATRALTLIGHWLRSQGYTFVTVSPATHAAVVQQRATVPAAHLRDVFGWSLPFAKTLLPVQIVDALRAAGLLETHTDGLFRSRVRFSTLGNLVFPHSAYPTTQSDCVFFGPDTYRFAALIQRELRASPLAPRSRVLDVGCGTGAGGLVVATFAGSVDAALVLSDISATALDFARASVALAGMEGVDFRQADLFAGLDGEFDLIVANPPYLNDATERLYRHGGGRWGEALSLRILREGLPRLSRQGKMVLYTGSAIVQGVDALGDALRADLASLGFEGSYEEIDPAVFGDELTQPAYAGVDRIAAVSLVVRNRPS